MSRDPSRPVILFAGLAHMLHHIVTALFMTVVLVLVPLWQRPYEELIALWTAGALLLGLGAPLAGWLGDKWGERRMMLVSFFGVGAATMACGLARGPTELQVALAAVGLFGAIYHPVGTSWIVRHAPARGRAIAIVGAFGGVGVAAASLVAGLLTDLIDWRAAFFMPGAVLLLCGFALLVASWRGIIADRTVDRQPPSPGESGAGLRVTVALLVVAMSLTSVAWYAFQTMLPKWLGREVGASLGSGLIGIGSLVAGVYLVATLAQFVGGHYADRGRTKEVYVASFIMKLVAIAVASQVSGWPVVVAAIFIALVFDVAAPIENILIARHTPPGQRGLAYGLRHGMAIVSAPLGVQLVSWTYDESRGFGMLLAAMAAIVVVILVAALLLPSERVQSVARKDTAAAA
jgi:MFS family permease